MDTNLMDVKVAAAAARSGSDGREWMTAFAMDLREKTRAAYQQALRVFEGWYEVQNGTTFEPGMLTSWDVKAWRGRSLEVERVKAATWNVRRAALAHLVQWARREGRLTYDPLAAAGTGTMKQDVGGVKWLDDGQYHRLMRQVEMDVNAANTQLRRRLAMRDAAMVGLMAFAGLRVGEVVALRVEDVTLAKRGGSVLVRMGKGEKERQVPLNLEARRLAAGWLGVRGEAGVMLFPGEDGMAMKTRAVEKRLAAIGARAGVELTPHALRHTCAKRMVDGGVGLEVVQRVLGHESIGTTARYAQPGWTDLERAVERI